MESPPFCLVRLTFVMDNSRWRSFTHSLLFSHEVVMTPTLHSFHYLSASNMRVICWPPPAAAAIPQRPPIASATVTRCFDWVLLVAFKLCLYSAYDCRKGDDVKTAKQRTAICTHTCIYSYIHTYVWMHVHCVSGECEIASWIIDGTTSIILGRKNKTNIRLTAEYIPNW